MENILKNVMIITVRTYGTGGFRAVPSEYYFTNIFYLNFAKIKHTYVRIFCKPPENIPNISFLNQHTVRYRNGGTTDFATK